MRLEPHECFSFFANVLTYTQGAERHNTDNGIKCTCGAATTGTTTATKTGPATSAAARWHHSDGNGGDQRGDQRRGWEVIPPGPTRELFFFLLILRTLMTFRRAGLQPKPGSTPITTGQPMTATPPMTTAMRSEHQPKARTSAGEEPSDNPYDSEGMGQHSRRARDKARDSPTRKRTHIPPTLVFLREGRFILFC